MLGHGTFSEVRYHFQTRKDYVSLLTPELLDEINQRIVSAGHDLVKKADEALHGRCGLFVLRTRVPYPIDINLLWDAMRKVITRTARWSDELERSD